MLFAIISPTPIKFNCEKQLLFLQNKCNPAAETVARVSELVISIGVIGTFGLVLFSSCLSLVTDYGHLLIRNKKLGRIKAGIYEENRMAKRTAGQLMKSQNYLIVGLGSVGSNLCYYLNGYNNAKFALVDPDNLTVDNIGRHLLGFNYIDQQKASAVAEYLTLYRPDRKVDAIAKHVEELSKDQINKASAIFLCTGDIMSEKWLLDKLRRKEVSIPSFILWLEPYGVSGIMIYVNPSEEDVIKKLTVTARGSFLCYCLIDSSEYETDKLIQRDAGCNGSYALYSANDVTLFLSAMFQHIDRLLETPSNSKVYRWVGNIEIATKKNIQLVADAVGLRKNSVQELPL